jgi:hypothetical protein
VNDVYSGTSAKPFSTNARCHESAASAARSSRSTPRNKCVRITSSPYDKRSSKPNSVSNAAHVSGRSAQPFETASREECSWVADAAVDQESKDVGHERMIRKSRQVIRHRIKIRQYVNSSSNKRRHARSTFRNPSNTKTNDHYTPPAAHLFCRRHMMRSSEAALGILDECLNPAVEAALSTNSGG